MNLTCISASFEYSVDLKGLQIPDTGGDLTTEDTIIGYLLADSVIRGAGIVSNGLEVNVTSQNTRLSGDISADCLNSYVCMLFLSFLVTAQSNVSYFSLIIWRHYLSESTLIPQVPRALLCLQGYGRMSIAYTSSEYESYVLSGSQLC